MKIQLNTDNNISGTEALENFVSEKITHALGRFSDRLTRVEVHLSDQNANKGGSDDIQCRLEARMEGMQPVVVTSRSNSKDKAIGEAINKMKATLSSVIGKMKDR